MEEGTQSGWLYETLERHVDGIVVASVPDGRGPKYDARDAYGLAESCEWVRYEEAEADSEHFDGKTRE